MIDISDANKYEKLGVDDKGKETPIFWKDLSLLKYIQ